MGLSAKLEPPNSMAYCNYFSSPSSLKCQVSRIRPSDTNPKFYRHLMKSFCCTTKSQVRVMKSPPNPTKLQLSVSNPSWPSTLPPLRLPRRNSTSKKGMLLSQSEPPIQLRRSLFLCRKIATSDHCFLASSLDLCNASAFRTKKGNEMKCLWQPKWSELLYIIYCIYIYIISIIYIYIIHHVSWGPMIKYRSECWMSESLLILKKYVSHPVWPPVNDMSVCGSTLAKNGWRGFYQ